MYDIYVCCAFRCLPLFCVFLFFPLTWRWSTFQAFNVNIPLLVGTASVLLPCKYVLLVQKPTIITHQEFLRPPYTPLSFILSLSVTHHDTENWKSPCIWDLSFSKLLIIYRWSWLTTKSTLMFFCSKCTKLVVRTREKWWITKDRQQCITHMTHRHTHTNTQGTTTGAEMTV